MCPGPRGIDASRDRGYCEKRYEPKNDESRAHYKGHTEIPERHQCKTCQACFGVLRWVRICPISCKNRGCDRKGGAVPMGYVPHSVGQTSISRINGVLSETRETPCFGEPTSAYCEMRGLCNAVGWTGFVSAGFGRAHFADFSFLTATSALRRAFTSSRSCSRPLASLFCAFPPRKSAAKA